MESAGTVDLRGDKVLPYVLRVLGTRATRGCADAVGVLRAWLRSGGHRLDRDHDGTYDNAEAISILDRWWPKWLRAEFRPALGARPYKALKSIAPLDDDPNNSTASTTAPPTTAAGTTTRRRTCAGS